MNTCPKVRLDKRKVVEAHCKSLFFVERRERYERFLIEPVHELGGLGRGYFLLKGLRFIERAHADYTDMFNLLYDGRADKYPSLMDVATIGAKALKRQGYVTAQDVSPEINACTFSRGKPDLVAVRAVTFCRSSAYDALRELAVECFFKRRVYVRRARDAHCLIHIRASAPRRALDRNVRRGSPKRQRADRA